MGKGEGSPEYYACRLNQEELFEVDGVSEEIAREALYKALQNYQLKLNL